MNDEIKKQLDIFNSMPRGTEEEGDARDRFYVENVFPLKKDGFAPRPGHEPLLSRLIGCDCMVLTVGTTFEPLAYSIYYLKPKKILFLHTEDTFCKIKHILDANDRKFDETIKLEEVEKTNAMELYEAITKQYERWGNPKNVPIDITGGTKAMAAAAAITGSMIDSVLVYVTYSDGVEYLEIVGSPYQISGKVEYAKVLSQMQEGHYASAVENLGLISAAARRSIGDTYDQLSYLANCYKSWEDLDFKNAKCNMDRLYENTINLNVYAPGTILCNKIKKLKKQQAALDILCSQSALFEADTERDGIKSFNLLVNEKEFICHIIFSMFSNAVRKAGHKKYDMAALLIYRVLELISQRRLATWGINTVRPIYNDANNRIKGQYNILNRYNECCRAIDERILTELPSMNLSLMQNFILLYALKDSIFKEGESKSKNDLKKLRVQVKARNRGVFAHGFEITTEEKYKEILEAANKWLRLFCEVEDIDIGSFKATHAFITQF